MSRRLISVVIAHNASSQDRKQRLSVCKQSIYEDAATSQVLIDLHIVSEGNKSEARNFGALHSMADIILFFDDDVKLRQGCINELLIPFKDQSVGIVGGVNIAFADAKFEEQIGASLLASPLTMFKSCSRYTPRGDVRVSDESEVLSAVMAVRRDAFIRAHGFPIDIIPCEENVLINRIQALGYKIIYNPFAIVYHRRPAVFRQYFWTIFNYGRGRGLMMRRLKVEGRPKMLWTPNRRWLYYIGGFICHYVAYISGVIWGFFSGEHEHAKN